MGASYEKCSRIARKEIEVLLTRMILLSLCIFISMPDRMKTQYKVGIFCIYLFFSCLLSAQTSVSRYMTEYQIDSLKKKELRLDIDNLFFFKNNEFGNSVMKGYTLPGAWINPKLSYVPLSNIKFEAGVYMLWYSGAYKYPNYAYQDIAKWKGVHYQNGTHLLPYFRGQIALGNFNFVLGNIYGGANHGLILPLYNPELNLTADPETGFQILYDTPRFHLDAWINWQSFIFDIDTHQESFIAGVTSDIKLNSPQSKWHWYVPIQMVAQHRGGEIDETETGVETFMNASLGVGLTRNLNREKLKRINWEFDVLGYYQQAGELWPFDKGLGWYAKMGADFEYLSVQAGAFTCNKFISLLGSPYFGAVSTRHKGGYYEGNPMTGFLTMDYSRTFAKLYSFGLKGELFYNIPGDLSGVDVTMSQDSGKGMGVSVGAYFRLNLSFLLKKFTR